MRRRALLLAVLALAAGAAPAAPVHIAALVPHARLAGQGRFTWFTLPIYDAALWVGDQGYRPGAPFALDLRYARKLAGARIADASAEQMAKLGARTAGQRQAWLERMRALFPDVREGSHITGVALADGGAAFYLDGKALGTLTDPAFARAFFAIWLDPATAAPALRQALLKDAAPR